jgi:endonuclease/exonuclease/phosphatase family metal-dependent hydrolase
VQSRADTDPEARLSSSATLTVASLNLHCGISWQGQPFDVAAAICALDAAVICLQEVWLPRPAGPSTAKDAGPARPDEVGAAAKMLGAALYRVPQRSGLCLGELGLPAGSGPGDLCLAVLTTLPVAGYEIQELGQAPADHVPRRAQVLSVRLAGGLAVRIVNTHLTHRLTSPLQLQRLHRSLRAEPVPTVIAGDLNMPGFVAARLAGFRPAVRGRTWPAWQPLVQLDHLLAGQQTCFQGGAVLAPTGSDHLPVRATISLPGPSQPS